MDPNLKVEISEIRSEFRLLQQQHTTAVERMTEVVQGVKQELGNVSRRLEDVTRLQVNHEQHRDSIDRAFRAIRDLAESVDTGFKAAREDESAWREKHVAENQATRDKVIWFSGAAAMLSLIATVAWGLVVYYNDKADAFESKERARIEAAVQDLSVRTRNLEQKP